MHVNNYVSHIHETKVYREKKFWNFDKFGKLFGKFAFTKQVFLAINVNRSRCVPGFLKSLSCGSVYVYVCVYAFEAINNYWCDVVYSTVKLMVIYLSYILNLVLLELIIKGVFIQVA